MFIVQLNSLLPVLLPMPIFIIVNINVDYLSSHNVQVAADEKKKLDEFFAVNSYVRGSYDTAADFKKLNDDIVKLSKPGANRLFYLALPPSTYESVATMIKATCMAQGSVCTFCCLLFEYITKYRVTGNHRQIVNKLC